MSLTPKEQADIDAETVEYEARQERMRAEYKTGRYGRALATWRRRLAEAAAGAVPIEPGTTARRLLVGGTWHDGQWVLTYNAETHGDNVMWWVDPFTRGVIPHGLVQGWQLAPYPVRAQLLDPLDQASRINGAQPAPDCSGSGNVWQVQSEVGDTGVVEEPDGSLRTASTASDSGYCPDCEHMIPLAAQGDRELGDVLVLVDHDTDGLPFD